MMGFIVIDFVFATQEYDRFSFLKENVKIDRQLVEKIKKLLKQGKIELPITCIVNENLEILDGFNYFIAFKELNLPIIYIIYAGYGLAESLLLGACENE